MAAYSSTTPNPCDDAGLTPSRALLPPPERNSGEFSHRKTAPSSFRRRSVVRKKVLAAEERNCDWALTWWALADIPEPATPKGEFRMSYSTKQAIYYGEVCVGPVLFSMIEPFPGLHWATASTPILRKLVELCSQPVKMATWRSRPIQRGAVDATIENRSEPRGERLR